MPTTVELPDGVSVEFPDGMDELSMHQEITKAFPQFASQLPSEKTSIPAPGEMMPTVTAQTLPSPVQAFPVQQQQMEQGKLETPPTGKETEQMLMTPQVSIPRFGKEGTATRGVSELVSMPFETMTAPAGPLIATAQMIPGLGELVDATFAASLAKQGAQRLGQASVTGNRQDYVQGVGELVLGALAGRGAAHPALESNRAVETAKLQAADMGALAALDPRKSQRTVVPMPQMEFQPSRGIQTIPRPEMERIVQPSVDALESSILDSLTKEDNAKLERTPDATVSERSAAEIPVEEPPRDRGEVGARTPIEEEAPLPQKEEEAQALVPPVAEESVGGKEVKPTAEEKQPLPELAPKTAKLRPGEKGTGDLFSNVEQPFNLAGEKVEMVAPKVETTKFGEETLTQNELFSIQKVVNHVDPNKSALAAEQIYGSPAKASQIIKRQLDVIDADPKTKKNFTKEQRERLKEVLNILREREKTPSMVGMGAAVPEEFTQPGTIVSNMFAAIDRDRAELGKPPMEPGTPRTWDQDQATAMAKLNRDPEWASDLITDVLQHPRPLLSWEHAGLVIQKAFWKAEANNALKALGEAVRDGRQEDIVESKARAAAFEDKLTRMEKAVGRGGTGSEAGRTLQAQKMGLTDDLTLVEMRLQARAAVGMRDLTEKESSEIAALHEKYQAALKAEKELTEKANAGYTEAQARAALAEIARQAAESKVPPPHIQQIIERVGNIIHKSADDARARLKGKLFTIGDPTLLLDLAKIGADNIWTIGEDFARWSVKMAEDIGEHVKPHLQQIWDASKRFIDETVDAEAGIKRAKATFSQSKTAQAAKTVIKKGDSPQQKREKLTTRIQERVKDRKGKPITPLVQQLARAFVESGVEGVEPLIDAVHEVLTGIVPDWTRRQTMDAISGYGDYKNLSKDQVSLILRDLKGQMQQMAKLEDMASKKAPLRTGLERRGPSKEETALIKAVNEAKRKGGYETTDPAKQLRSALEEVKKKTQTDIEEYERRLREGDVSVRRLEPIKPDPELVRAQFRKQDAKKKFETMKKKLEYEGRPKWERALDWITGFRRFSVLSGPRTLVKLLAYSATKPATTLATEIAGKGLKRIPLIRQIAEKAPAEGETSVRAFARSYAKAMTLGMKDAWQVMTKHRSELSNLYDKRAPEPFHWTQFNGLLHEAEKSPLRRAAFEHALAKLTEHAIRNRADITDLGVMTALKYEAYRQSNRALLLEDNKLASAIRTGWAILESKNKRTGKPNPMGKLAATLGRTEMPIIRVPLNFAKQTMEAAMGVPAGIGKIMFNWENLSKLRPEEYDAIFRNLKNGSVGGAIALYAFFDGYYGWNNFGGYWEPGDKRKPKDAAFGTIRIGGYNVPSIVLHNPFFEAGQLANTMGRLMSPRHGSKSANPPAAVVASALGLMEHSPLGSEATEFSKMVAGPDHINRINEHMASYLKPQLTTTIADWMDPRKRNPKGFVQHVETGYPGLRKKVPLKQPR